MYIYKCRYTYTYIYIYLFVRIYKHIYTHIYPPSPPYTHTHTHTQTHTQIHTHIYTTHTRTHTQTHTQKHTHTHNTHTHTHTHTHTPVMRSNHHRNSPKFQWHIPPSRDSYSWWVMVIYQKVGFFTADFWVSHVTDMSQYNDAFKWIMSYIWVSHIYMYICMYVQNICTYTFIHIYTYVYTRMS